MAGPLGLQADLDSLKARRALATALRLREGNDSQYGGIEKFAAALSRGMFGDPMDEFDRKEQELIKQYESNLTKGYEGVLELEDPTAMKRQAKVIPVPGDGVGPPAMDKGEEFTSADLAQRASTALAAGVPPELIQKALARRRSAANMKAWGMDPATLLAGGGGGGDTPTAQMPPGGGGGQMPQGAGGASGSAPSVLPYVGGGTQGGGAPAGQPAAPAPQGGSPGAPPGGNPLAAAFAGGGGLYPQFAKLSEGQLIGVMSGMSSDDQMRGVLEAELKARKVEPGPNGVFLRNGKPVAKIENGILHDFVNNVTSDLSGNILTARKKAEAGAEAEAKFPGETVQTVDADGRPKTVFKSQLPGAPYQPQRPAPAPGGKRINLNFSGTAEEVDAYVKQALADQAGGGGGGAPQPAIGTGPAPLEVKQKEADISVGQAGQTELVKTQAKVLEKSKVDATAAAQVVIPQIHEARKMLDTGNVTTGAGAEFVTGFGRWLKTAGLSDGDGVQATQTFVAQSAKRVMAILSSGALGAGSGITERDLQFAKDAAGGNIALDEGTIRRILDIDEKAARAAIAFNARTVGQLSDMFKTPEQRAFFEVPMPPVYVSPKDRDAQLMQEYDRSRYNVNPRERN